MLPPLYPLSGEQHFTRRSFLLGTASFAAAALWSSSRLLGATVSTPKFSANPFSLGVASGDPTAEGVVLWTKLAPKPLEPGGGMPAQPIEVSWIVAEDEALSRVVQRGTAMANPQWGHSVHVEVSGLRPERWYWYQFSVGSETSAKGRTRTFPVAGTTPERLRFAFASCQHYETGLFTAFEHLAREDLDLIVHLGDYIYEGGVRDAEAEAEAAKKKGTTPPVRIRQHIGPQIMTLDEYRARYALYRLDPALQAAHAAAPWIVTWDDHEVANNYAGDHLTKMPSRRAFRQRRAAAYQAYYEMMPLRRAQMPKGPDLPLHRRLDYGTLASFHVLDTRQYRTIQPQGDGNKPFADVLLDPKGTLLGDAQRDWLFRGLEASASSWNVLTQQVMMARVDKTVGEAATYSMDQWPGYEFERRRVLRHLHERKIKNPVVLTGDIHTNWANELLADFDRPEAEKVAVEFVGTSISSGGDGQQRSRNQEAMVAENPCVKFFNAERGYVTCEITPKTWRTDYKTVPFVTRPGAPLNTRATFLVESGRPVLNRV